MLRVSQKYCAGPTSGMLRPTTTALAMRRTNPNLIPIPPFLVQVIKTIAINAGKQFVAAHMAESERLRRQQAENTHNNGYGQQEDRHNVGGGGGFSSSSPNSLPRPRMTADEALQILNVNPNLAVPLRGNEDKALATANFKNYFQKAEETNSIYLQGKLSQAYRMCVDDKWDKDKV